MNCLIPCDLAPGLSFPYPSNRLITPHTARPAPIATTSVCKILIAEVKNAIVLPITGLFRYPFFSYFSMFTSHFFYEWWMQAPPGSVGSYSSGILSVLSKTLFSFPHSFWTLRHDVAKLPLLTGNKKEHFKIHALTLHYPYLHFHLRPLQTSQIPLLPEAGAGVSYTPPHQKRFSCQNQTVPYISCAG